MCVCVRVRVCQCSTNDKLQNITTKQMCVVDLYVNVSPAQIYATESERMCVCMRTSEILHPFRFPKNMQMTKTSKDQS